MISTIDYLNIVKPIIRALIVIIIPILSYFVSHYFFLKWFLPKQKHNKFGLLTTCLTVCCILLGLLIFYASINESISTYLSTLPVVWACINVLMFLSLPLHYIITIHTPRPGIGLLLSHMANGWLMLFVLLQIFIQIIFSKQLFDLPPLKVILPIIKASLLSYVISMTILIYLSYQYLVF